MLTPRNPNTAACVQAPPSPARPAALKGLSRETFARRLARLDFALLALVLVLAFFLGSFMATNSDIFLHLGLGSPFGPNADPSGWVHHAWLPSLLLGLIYEPYSPSAEVGGRWAVIVKALVVVLLAFVLSRFCRPGQSRFIAIACAGLAVLVMSPRLTLHPMVISLLFLALTLWLLTMSAYEYPRAIWFLPALFALWVNMDQWFFLGPVTVALWLIGEALRTRLVDSRSAVAGASLAQLAEVLVIGLVCCLLNPWFHRAFTLPVELAYPLRQVLPPSFVEAGITIGRIQESDPQFLAVWSPLSPEYFGRPQLGRHAAGLAYFALLLLGIASFIAPAFLARPVHAQQANPERSHNSLKLPLAIVFVMFALVSAFNYRLIPFFAVVAAPITAINLQDYFHRGNLVRFANLAPSPASSAANPTSVTPNEFNWALGSRAVVFIACLVALVCAWPGWLNANPGDWRVTRHVDWAVAEDGGVIQAAELINQVHRQTGLCKQGFNYTVEGGNLFLGIGTDIVPAPKLLCDARFSVHRARASDYAAIRKALRDEAEIFLYPPPKDAREQEEMVSRINKTRAAYQSRMREMAIDFVIFTRLNYDQPTWNVVECFLVDRFREWVLLYHDGRTAVFGWIDPADPQRNEDYRAWRLDFNRLVPPTTPPPNVPQVLLPADWIASAPINASSDSQQYLFGPLRPTLSSFQAGQYLEIYNRTAADWRRRSGEFLIAAIGGPAAEASGLLQKGMVLTRKDAQGSLSHEQLFLARDDGPPAAPLLAVRATRRAVYENPNEFTANLFAAQAYQLLQARQEDYWNRRPARWLYGPFKPGLRHQLRLIQTSTALHNAATIQPGSSSIHAALHEFYLGIDYVDLALDHLLLAAKSLESQVAAGREQAERFKLLKDQYAQRIKHWSAEVERRRNEFKLENSVALDPVEKFWTALLDRKAKDALGNEQIAPRGLIKLGQQVLREGLGDVFKKDERKAQLMWTWELYLLLTTGQAREANALLHDKVLQPLLQGGEFDLLRALAAAALGDYGPADKYLEKVEKSWNLPSDDVLLDQQRQPMAELAKHLAAAAGLMPSHDTYAGPSARAGLHYVWQLSILKELVKPAEGRRMVAELRLVRGLLALERGDSAAAADHFQGSIRILPPVLPVGLEFADRPVAKRYLELLQAK